VTVAATAPLAIDHALAQATTAPGQPSPEPPSIEELLRDAEVRDTALSPDGARVAILIRKTIEKAPAAYIVFYEIAKSDPPNPVNLGDYDVERIEWANDERLLVWVQFHKNSVTGKPSGFWYYDTFVPVPTERLFAIDASGKNGVLLLNNDEDALDLFHAANVVDMMRGDPRHILMQIWNSRASVQALHKVDIYTGEAVLVEKGGGQTNGWFTQNGVPVLRYDSNSRGTLVTIYARAPGETKWTLFRKIRRNELEQLADITFVAATPEPGVVLSLGFDEGADMPTVRKFDTRTLQAGDIVAQDAAHQIKGVFVDEAYTPLAVSVSDDRTRYKFFDPVLEAHYKGVNTYFANACSIRPYDVSRDHKRFIFHVSGPRNPGAFWLYDTEKHDLEPLGTQRPWLRDSRLAPMKAVAVRARDGQSITAYVTTPLPSFAEPRPLVVVPHGGPEVRDQLDFDLFAQAFAAQGWIVLQPNFRGSGGYGKAFADKGRRRWGDLMQQDVEDCVAHVLAQGGADPSKVAICGASYGGYAALMGAVLRPDLYKAVVSISGDADLAETLAFSRSEDGAESSVYEYWVKTIGDPKADRTQLAWASPALRAAEIKAPVLLVHGTEDRIVSPKQSRIMAKALTAAGKSVEFVELKGVGHRNWTNENWQLVLEKSVAHIRKGFA
jgi:dipeptidyl aminopeptidase/acylaminoacyl peptidase